MCGRYAQTKSARTYQRYLRAQRMAAGLEERPSWNVAPSLATLIADCADDGELVLSRQRWGITGISGLISNARQETAAEKPAFREAWRTGRAVVPIDGWYEWKTTEGLKQAYYFAPMSGEPVLLVALISGEGHTLVTAETTGPLRTVHTRRPVAITLAMVHEWCRRDASWTPERLTESMVPEDAFSQTPVGPKVNSTRNDGPELIARAEILKPAASQLSLGI